MSVKHGLICENKCMVEGVTKEEFDTKVSGSMEELTDDLIKRAILISGGEIVPNLVGKYENNTSITVGPYIETRFATSHERMFNGATALNTFTNYDLTNSTNVNSMYKGTALTSVPEINAPKVTNASDMFSTCPLQSVSDINMPEVKYASNMFYNNTPLHSVSNLNMPKVNSISSFFDGCKNLSSIGSINWGGGNVSNLTRTFYGCGSLTQREFDKINIKVVDKFNAQRCYSDYDNNGNGGAAGQLNIDYSRASTLSGLYQQNKNITVFNGGCEKGDPNSGIETDCERAFQECSNLSTLKNFFFNVSKAERMFYNCVSLEELPPLNWFNCTSFTYFLRGCTSLKKLGDINFKPQYSGQVSSISFDHLTSLTTLTDNPYAEPGTCWNFDRNVSMGKIPLDRPSILKVFNGLLPATATITISSTTNSYLTEEDKIIATSKGWTVSVA